MKTSLPTSSRWGALVLGVALALAGRPAQAQAPGSTGPTPGTPQADPTAVPLDGGAPLLLAAGVGLGLLRLRWGQRRSAQ